MRFDLPEKKKLVHQMTMPIRWGDMDAMGHVNNTLYFRYLEVIRIEWMRSVGCNMSPDGEGPVIINAFCTFHKQLEYPGEVLAKYYVSDPGRSTFESWCTLERTDTPGVVHSSGGATTVWVDFPKQKSVPMPEWFRALLE
ncbi:MAG: acyl-CoA thioesterase [Burkholderiales bacterium]|nr:acyl-CoA thioesterase [Burkholderiales bacterium]